VCKKITLAGVEGGGEEAGWEVFQLKGVPAGDKSEYAVLGERVAEETAGEMGARGGEITHGCVEVETADCGETTNCGMEVEAAG